MSCQASHIRLNPYADGELDLQSGLEVEQHLRECAGCEQAYSNLRVLQRSLRSDELRYEPSTDFEKRLRAKLRRETGGRARMFDWRRWIPALSAAAFLLVVAGYLLTRSTTDDLVASEIVSSHVRSMMTSGHLIDVQSEDQHTVKPWFDGKLDFAPPVRDLTAQGFSLVGGRLDYIANRPVAVLIYQRHKHVINVFIWPASDGDTKSIAQVRQGFNLIHWTKSGMTYWAVSDLNLAELQEFESDMNN